jgi:hypothetical protein
MFRPKIILVLPLLMFVGGCTATPNATNDKIERSCGLLGCISSPYLHAKGSASLIGMPLASAVAQMGSAPTSSVDLGNGTTLMSWTRTQTDDMGLASCTENLTVKNGMVIDYSGKGNC